MSKIEVIKMSEKWLYKVGFKPGSLIIPLLTTAIFAAVTVIMNGFFILVIFTVAVALISLYSAYCILFVKLLIGENSFCHCKSPWNKKEYRYADISEAWESKGTENNGVNASYFNYRTPDGKVERFLFYPYQYDEIIFLLEKINNEDYFNSDEENENE